MLKLSALFFFLLIASSSKAETLDNINSIISEKERKIKQDLNELMVQVKSTTSTLDLKDIIKRLTLILKSLQETQFKHSSSNKKMMTNCKFETVFRKREIKDANISLDLSVPLLLNCKKSLNSAKGTLTDLERVKRNFQGLISKEEKRRNIASQNSLIEQKDLKDAIKFLTNFYLTLINGNLGRIESYKESFLQKAAKIGIIQQAAPILMELSLSKLNLSKLAELVLDLNNVLKVDLKRSELIESQDTSTSRKLIQSYQNVINKVSKYITRTRKHLVEMDKCISTENKIISDSYSKYLRNLRLLKLGETTCRDFIRFFVSATRNRLGEIQVVTGVINIIEKRYSKLPFELINLLSSVNKHFKNYVNSTPFKAYVTYSKKKVSLVQPRKKLY